MSDLVARYNEAEKLKDAGKYDESIALLNGIIEEDPTHVLSHLTLARVYTLVGKHDAAIEHARQACEIEPTDPFNFTAMSVTYQRAFAGTGDRQYIQLAEDAMARAHSMN
jgi:tetratricopeptide (TPR) repeat protein